MASFDITTSQTALNVKPGDKLEVIFTVVNLADDSIDGVPRITSPGGSTVPSWAAVVSEKTVAFGPKETKQVTVRLTPPDDLPKAEREASHPFQLAVSNKDEPEGEASTSGVVNVQLSSGRISIPVWAWIVAAILLVGIASATIATCCGPGDVRCEKDSCPPNMKCSVQDGKIQCTPQDQCRTNRDCGPLGRCISVVTGDGQKVRRCLRRLEPIPRPIPGPAKRPIPRPVPGPVRPNPQQ